MAKLTVECINDTFVQTLEVAGKKYVNTYVPYRYGYKILEPALEEQFGLDYPDAADSLLDKIEDIGFPDEIREALEALSEMEAAMVPVQEEPESNNTR